MALRAVNIAIIDMYNNIPNQGMLCITNIVDMFALNVQHITIKYTIFQARNQNHLPSTDYDIYISTGGPGDPHEGHNSTWETRYFQLIEKLQSHNANYTHNKKHVFFICFSFQLMCRFLKLATLNQRPEQIFGILPNVKTPQAEGENLLRNLPDPYYTVESRQWQVIHPDFSILNNNGCSILSRERVPTGETREPAITAIKFSETMAGTQFHPEATIPSLGYYLYNQESKKKLIADYGLEYYHTLKKQVQQHSSDITYTHNTILPTFLKQALLNLAAEEA